MDDDCYDHAEVPSGSVTGIKFDVSIDKDIENISAFEVVIDKEVNDTRLGLPNPSHQCSTCGAKDFKTCEGHFGTIKFPSPILHPYFLSEIIQILNKICPGCKSIRKGVRFKGADLKSERGPLKGCKYCAGSSNGWYPSMTFKVLSKGLFDRTAIMVEISGKLPKKKKNTKGELLPADYWDFIPKDPQTEENCKYSQEEEGHMESTRRVLSDFQVSCLLNDVDPNFIIKFVPRLDSLFLNCFPVTPNCHRVTEIMHIPSNGHRLMFDERTRAYRNVAKYRGTAYKLNSCVLDCLRISKLNTDNTSSDADVNKTNKENPSSTSGLRWVKDVVLGKRSDHTFRSVVVGDPYIKPSEVGIPCQIAENLLVSEYVNRQNRQNLLYYCELRILQKGSLHVRREGNLVRLTKNEELRLGDIIYRPLNDGDLILINRIPSIHQHSFISLSVRVLPMTSVVSINPLCCHPLRGDFDGDCLHGYISQSLDAKVELKELVALDKQLINGQSGRNLMSLCQDSLTAAYLLMEDGVVFDEFQMQQLQMFCPYQLPFPAIIKSPLLKTKAWNGKQLFNMLFPPDFNYSSSSNNLYVCDGELLSSSEGFGWLSETDGNIIQSLVQHCQGKSLDFLDASQVVLCEWLSMRGLTVSLADLYLSPDSYSRRNMIDEISYGLQDAEHACNFTQFLVDCNRNFLSGNSQEKDSITAFDVERLCYERQISVQLNQASVDVYRHVFREIQSLVYKYASKGNSFLSMLKAGSKGNLQKLVQHCVSVGLQHSLSVLSFRIPRQLTCASWNYQKAFGSSHIVDGPYESTHSYIPCAVVKNSFLTGMNPLECFVHSVTSRDSSFSGNADLPGTLTRKLMFFMRDLYAAYDGTVRNAYGNQLVQFSYNSDVDSSCGGSSQDSPSENARARNMVGGEPIGSLSACAMSEAAYSALDQPISLLQSSPLLNLKNVLECGTKKTGNQTVSLYLNEELGRRRHGFEYAALEVKNHLERLLFSDIVSTIMIIFTPQLSSRMQFSPWVCHFHVCEDILKRRGLNLDSVIKTLYQRCDSLRKASKVGIPCLQISRRDCSITDTSKEANNTSCITVTTAEESRNSSVPLEAVRDKLIPLLLGIAIKGFHEILKVDILWKDRPKVPKSRSCSSGELYLRVKMSGDFSANTRFWGILKNNCLRIMHMIDWGRSHPDNIHHCCSVYGIDAGWKHFLNRLESAISDTGKTVLPKHMLLVANSLSSTGEFIGLNAKGMARQREHASISAPFKQACFSSPGACFIKAAKAGATDDLQGTLDALAWGNLPAIGTGAKFEIVYSDKGYQLSKATDIYTQLGVSFVNQSEKTGELDWQNYTSDKCGAHIKFKNSSSALKGLKNMDTLTMLRSFLTLKDVQNLANALKSILHKYPIGYQLSERDQATLMMALYFHPNRNEKIGSGAEHIKVGYHPKHEDVRCFMLVRLDGTVEDFSYRKCIAGALEIIAPQRAKSYQTKWLVEGA